MSEEIGQLASHESSQGVAFDDMLNTAKKKAQEKLDSIAAVEQARMRREQIKKARQDSILLEKRLALQRDENRAFQISVEIYDLLDKNKTQRRKAV